MEQIVLPDAINLEDDAVVILWEDAHRSPFPHRYLRLRCPCANCVDEMSGKRTLDPDTVPQDVKAVDQMPAGKYGVQFLWTDHIALNPQPKRLGRLLLLAHLARAAASIQAVWYAYAA